MSRRAAFGPRLAAAAFLALCALWAPAAQAFSPDRPLADAALESRALVLHDMLRCMVCQGQAISDSNAALAQDMRAVVRQRIAEGESDEEVLRFLTDRYGDYILLNPPIKPATYALWFGPAAAFALGVGLVWHTLRRRRRASGSAAGAPGDGENADGVKPLTAEERRRLDALLSDSE